MIIIKRKEELLIRAVILAYELGLKQGSENKLDNASGGVIRGLYPKKVPMSDQKRSEAPRASAAPPAGDDDGF